MQINPNKKEKNIKVAVGLSGGVDSSVAAMLLQKEGCEITGVHMQCWDYNLPGCKGNEDRSDAVKIASILNIPFIDLNFEKEYKEKVLGYFFNDLNSGRTPNPDVMCNSEIKFGLFLNWALENGYDYVATGHYARNEILEGTHRLYSGNDNSKDQSYFLYKLNQSQLKHVLFPLGNFKKTEIRKMAKDFGLPVHDKPDSTGICFIGDIDVKDFIKLNVETRKGDIVDLTGEVIGEHEGTQLYTIGQRHGFNINKYSGLPMYVIKKDAQTNTLIVGFAKDAQTKEFIVEACRWFYEIPNTTKNCQVKIRNLGSKNDCIIENLEDGKFKVVLNDYELGVAPGQSAVFYQGALVLGGGTIS